MLFLHFTVPHHSTVLGSCLIAVVKLILCKTAKAAIQAPQKVTAVVDEEKGDGGYGPIMISKGWSCGFHHSCQSLIKCVMMLSK